MNETSTNPLALIAELTHRCPLHCVYCSNPLELQSRSNELSTEIWSGVFKEAAAAGVLQADFTGGEPLARPDIVDLVRNARSAGLYVSLITSGLPLDEAKLEALVRSEERRVGKECRSWLARYQQKKREAKTRREQSRTM